MSDHHPGSRAVRASVPADLPHFHRIIGATGLFPPELLDDMAAPFFAGADESSWLTLEQGKPQGLAYCAPERFTDGTWNLLLIAVHPDLQRTGAGAALIRAVEDGVRKRGGRLLLVETSGLGTFAGQRAFYLAQGYREEARIAEFYQAGEDKVVFWKRLTP